MAELEICKYVIARVYEDLPSNKDWLNPVIEEMLKKLAIHQHGEELPDHQPPTIDGEPLLDWLYQSNKLAALSECGVLIPFKSMNELVKSVRQLLPGRES